MNINIKNIRFLHTSLNHKRKCHIFKIFKKQEGNSPFEYKGDDSNDQNITQESLKKAKEQLQSFEYHNIQQEKEKAKLHKKSVNLEQNEQVAVDSQNTSNLKEHTDVSIDNDVSINSTKQSTTKSQQNTVQQNNYSLYSAIKIHEDAEEIQFGNLQKNKFEYQKQQIKKSILPPFQQLDDGLIHQHTMYSKNIQLHSPYRWTPYIQNQDVSDREFQLKMKQFRKKKLFEDNDEAELIDTFLFQALKNTGFDYYYDYICQPSNSCPFHGRVDFLIYHRDSESKVPLIPILRARKEKNSLGEWIEKFNQAELLGAALWALTNMKARDQSISISRAIQTNGNQWRMIQINDKGDFEKTHIYTPEKDEFKKIYRDDAAQSVALGLIKFSLNQPTEQEEALKKIYDFVDERKYLTELDDETKQKLDRIHKNYFFLPKFIRDFLFNYK